MKKTLLLTLSFFWLISCTEDLDITKSSSTDDEIRVQMGIGTVRPATRGDGVITNSFANDLPVSFVRFDATGSGFTYATGSLIDATIRAGATHDVVFAPAQYYNPDGYNTKLTGLYPRADGTQAVWNPSTQRISFTVNGSTDIMCSNTIEGNKNNKALNTQFTFEHVLTRIQFYIYAANTLSADTWGKVETISVVNREKEIIYTLSAAGDGVFAPDGNNRGDLPMIVTLPDAAEGMTIPVSAAGDGTDVSPVGYVMFAPITDASHKLQFAVKMKDGYETSLEMSGKRWDAGYSYGVYIKFRDVVEISPRVTINDWNDIVVDDEIPIH